MDDDLRKHLGKVRQRRQEAITGAFRSPLLCEQRGSILLGILGGNVWNLPQTVPQIDASGPWVLPWESCPVEGTQEHWVRKSSALDEGNPEVGQEDLALGTHEQVLQ